ncbi:MAG: 50S ribosomal protein L15 [Bacteroidota bacterium]
MELHNLSYAKGAIHKSKRIGRGQGSGKGGTSTRGNNGQQARAGYQQKRAHEGGQMPLQRRVPKFGFTNIFRREYTPVNLDTIQKLADEKNINSFEIATFIENGLVSKKDLVKILGRGELKTKVNVKAHAFSASAKTSIEAKGGKAEVLIKQKSQTNI